MSRDSARRRVGTSNSFRYPPPPTPISPLVMEKPTASNRMGMGTAGQVERRRSMDMENHSTNRRQIEFVQKRNSGAPPINLVHDILLQQDLSRAGVLFSLAPSLILDDFGMTIEILKSLIDSNAYANNLNQQSIVEIVLTKCISALRLDFVPNVQILHLNF